VPVGRVNRMGSPAAGIDVRPDLEPTPMPEPEARDQPAVASTGDGAIALEPDVPVGTAFDEFCRREDHVSDGTTKMGATCTHRGYHGDHVQSDPDPRRSRRRARCPG
jgi:hypothetical protein